VPDTWQKKANKLLASYKIDPVAAVAMKYDAFKKLFHKQMVAAQATILQQATIKSTVVRNYVSHFGSNVQYAGPQGYLQSGSCGKGRELIMQLRVQSLPLKALTGKFDKSRSRGGTEFCCPTCHGSAETAYHFMIDCPTYALLRKELFDTIEQINSTKFVEFTSLTSEDKSWALINNHFWKSDDDKSGVKIILAVAVYTFEAWKLRNTNIAATNAMQNHQQEIVEDEDEEEGEGLHIVQNQRLSSSTSSAVPARGMLRVVDGSNPEAA
jgi:hypothetical protein